MQVSLSAEWNSPGIVLRYFLEKTFKLTQLPKKKQFSTEKNNLAVHMSSQFHVY